MTDYLSDDFLLCSPTARSLYHEHAAALPIIDFHSHIDPHSVADDRVFSDLAGLWISTDPYKWRAMRINGIAEHAITGSAPGREKFDAWAQTVPYTVGNPLFHWTSLELKRYFGIDALLSPKTAEAIWTDCNRQLPQPRLSAQGLLKQANVELLCTSDDLLDSLAPHRQMQAKGGALKMLPSLRADRIVAVDAPGFKAFCSALETASGLRIDGLEAFKAAIGVRLEVFQSLGCCVADVGLDQPVFEPAQDGVVAGIFDRLMAGSVLAPLEVRQLKTALLLHLGGEYHRRHWVMQLHIGAQRTTSQRLRDLTGGAGGYACIGSSSDVALVCGLLNQLESRDALPRTILFTLNPSDADMFASVTGSFTGEGIPGKVQLGPAWWFNDNRDGMVRQLKTLGNMGLLGRHIGMTTDSRSLLSYSRHEYYRRILCNLVGEWVEAGELPRNPDFLQTFIQDLCYFNARRWLRPDADSGLQQRIQGTP
ncbi:glucuronate isomerase [Polaromonas sp. CG_9.11]|uniref:glucuronate isomerase n=1 Tax=Polaromonas sp. CG_9.11 TaxID=2787730 RepID=UPI0018C936D6|nr:glucuronate isomerase [Polaromonas sp. CG_9.11]